MQPTSISVTFRKQVSDGNYGSEAAEVVLGATLPDDDRHDDQYIGNLAGDLLTEARAAVHAQLDLSPNMSVRRALERQEPRPVAPRQPVAEADLEEIPF